MTNYGNTGQRYRMSKFTGIQVLDADTLLITLSCGHSYKTPNSWSGTRPMFEKFIEQGKKTRCDECPVSKK